MADLPISGLPEATTPIAADLMAIVVDNATIPVTKKITWANLKTAMPTTANAITSGLDADKSATPEVGDVYYATDTDKLYLCRVVNVWAIPIATIEFVVSDTLHWSNDTERTSDAAAYTKLKEIKLNEPLSVCRIKFDMKSGWSTHNAYAKLYKNGVAIGTERINSTTTYATYTEDFTDFVRGDLIQIYVHRTDETTNLKVQNFRFYFTANITKIIGYPLTTPLTSSPAFVTNPTNQDPA